MRHLQAHFENGDVYSYTLENAYIKLKALNFGATITELSVRDKDGKFENVVASFMDVKDYEVQGGPYLNAVVGPVAGRIAYGKYEMDGVQHQLSINNGPHHLHGGSSGISKQMFTVKEESNSLHFHLDCTHDMDGFPQGVYTYDVWYRLKENQFIIEYQGTPPRKSLMNMTSHLYFNLSGDLKESILTHDLMVDSCEKLMIHSDGHPYQKAEIKKDSAFDFQKLSSIQQRFAIGDPEFAYTKAYDTPFLLGAKGMELVHAKSGRKLSIKTSAPSVVLYSANYFDDALVLNKHTKGAPFIALAMETQDVANGVNIEEIPGQYFAEPDQPYHQSTEYTFTIE